MLSSGNDAGSKNYRISKHNLEVEYYCHFLILFEPLKFPAIKCIFN